MITPEKLVKLMERWKEMERKLEFQENKKREIVEMMSNRGILGHRSGEDSSVHVMENPELVYIEMEKRIPGSVPLDNGRHLIRYPAKLLKDIPLIFGMPLRYNDKGVLEIDAHIAYRVRNSVYTDRPLLINKLKKAD